MSEQDLIEVMATADCPPHLLKFAGYGTNKDGFFCTIHRCVKCNHEEWIAMPDEWAKRRE